MSVHAPLNRGADLPHSMLVDSTMACDGGTGMECEFRWHVVVQPKESQVHLLNEIRDVVGGISHARSQVPPSLCPCDFSSAVTKACFGVGRQGGL